MPNLELSEQIERLASLLYACKAGRDEARRNRIVDALGARISPFIERHTAVKLDITAIVERCADSEDGIYRLLRATYRVEGASRSWAELETTAIEIGALYISIDGSFSSAQVKELEQAVRATGIDREEARFSELRARISPPSELTVPTLPLLLAELCRLPSPEQGVHPLYEFAQLVAEATSETAGAGELRAWLQRTHKQFSRPPTQPSYSDEPSRGRAPSAEPGVSLQPLPAQSSSPSSPARIFISYKRDVHPDEAVALAAYEALKAQHHVFIDQLMPIGTPWAARISRELEQADYLLVFLSEHSIASEMVRAELERAHQISTKSGRNLRILPVRLAYDAPFEYPLSAYLNHLSWASWRDATDTYQLLRAILDAVSGQTLPLSAAEEPHTFVGDSHASPRPYPMAQPLALEGPEGTMMPGSEFYVERAADRVALENIRRQGVTLTIKGPRQMGKSSLLIRTMDAAREAGKQVAYLDFQLVEQSDLDSADTFFRMFCAWLSDELALDDETERYWKNSLGNSQRCTRYVGRHILRSLGSPMVLAMDEVDRISEAPFRSDFFGMLRSWHNQRAIAPAWRQLDLALVTSTEPYQLVADLNQSPFNVGHILDLTDFDLEQVADLNERHGRPFSRDSLSALFTLLHGHPYLVRRAMYLVASDLITPEALFATAADERGPFSDHLRYHLFRMYDQPELVEGLCRILDESDCPDERIFFRLRGAGLVRREGRDTVARCLLYKRYFQERLRARP